MKFILRSSWAHVRSYLAIIMKKQKTRIGVIFQLAGGLLIIPLLTSCGEQGHDTKKSDVSSNDTTIARIAGATSLKPWVFPEALASPEVDAILFACPTTPISPIELNRRYINLCKFRYSTIPTQTGCLQKWILKCSLR